MVAVQEEEAGLHSTFTGKFALKPNWQELEEQCSEGKFDFK